MSLLDELRVVTTIWPGPVEIQGAIPFPYDDIHTTFEALQEFANK